MDFVINTPVYPDSSLPSSGQFLRVIWEAFFWLKSSENHLNKTYFSTFRLCLFFSVDSLTSTDHMPGFFYSPLLGSSEMNAHRGSKTAIFILGTCPTGYSLTMAALLCCQAVVYCSYSTALGGSGQPFSPLPPSSLGVVVASHCDDFWIYVTIFY